MVLRMTTSWERFLSRLKTPLPRPYSRRHEAGGCCDDWHMTQVRVDKWLWAARFYKTRSLAAEAVLGGHVHVNGARVKPAKEVRVGDSVEIRKAELRWSVRVTDVADRRGPAAAAAALYEETPESRAARERAAAERRLARPLGADLGARPTKQSRRRLDALRRAQRRSDG
jgi:ribosome-associated heat shock protein Hsp15